ncbi:DUF302 domain-containing protein [Thauera mechernichensis]|nr:DUF302 domain-containing protein [Thauera sp.]HNR59738.1 DUF302 domain-containing protein [Thauera sp.]HNS92454.1 DUF302 domain-containing protein [Thauera sp.]
MPDLHNSPPASATASLLRVARLAMALAVLTPGLAACADGNAEGIVTRHFAAVEFADAREALAEAIANEGIARPVESHFARMLDRTAADLGHAHGLYAEAEILTFCSAPVAAALVTEAREHIALCPLSIAVYTLREGEAAAVLAYRPPSLHGAGGDAARALMQRIVSRTARLLGQE